jgi:hypothetical protein
LIGLSLRDKNEYINPKNSIDFGVCTFTRLNRLFMRLCWLLSDIPSLSGDSSSIYPYPKFDPDVSWKRRLIKNGGQKQHHDQIFADLKGKAGRN